MTEPTRDALFGGKVTLAQPARGYRANVDALLLAAFAARKLGSSAAARPPARRVDLAVDLGAGCGAVGLSLLHWSAAARVTFVEIDGDAAALAQGNVDANGWRARADVLRLDVRELEANVGASLVVCNPPYFRDGHGRPAKHPQRRLARQGDLETFVRAARRICGQRARVCLVYPARDLSFLLDVARAAGLEPKRLRCVHASHDAPARVVLLEATPSKPGGLDVEPPLFERTDRGNDEALAALLRK